MITLSNCPLCHSSNQESFLKGKDFFLSNEDFEVFECHSCGFRYTNPRPEPDQLGAYYQSEDYVSHSDTRRGFVNNVYHYVKRYSLRRKFKLIASYKNTGKLLDIGCGSGAFPGFMQAKGFQVTAIEPDENARATALSTYGVEALPEEEIKTLAENSFDSITMWHVLEHVYALHQRMEQLQKLLSPEGYLFIALPNCNSWDAKHYREFWAAYDLPRHLYHFTQPAMEFLAGQYGFRIVKKLPMKFDAYYVSMLSEKYKGGSILNAFKNGFISNMKAAGGNMEYSSVIYVLHR
jgi:2-polyprenyl-3-methyl-5-hydroxy-6-metoxy-1,4-benzoquinol methylase